MRTIGRNTQEFLNYSKQCAYKALRYVRLGKNLNFKPEMWEETSKRSRSSTDRSIVDTDDMPYVAEREDPESGTRSSESPFFREMQRRLRKTWTPNIGRQSAQYKLFRSSSGRFSMIPARSLGEGSAFSAKFARYEIRESRSASILNALPKGSCFQRRNRDRCLSCMHKSLRRTDGAVPSQTTLLAEIEARGDSESSCDELREELQKMYRRKKEMLRYPENIVAPSDKSTSLSHQVEREDIAISTSKIEPNQSKNKTAKPMERSVSKGPKSLKAASISISMSSEPSKISSSEVHTSDDETSSPLALDDPSRYKNMAPCHLPTVFLPSMEPLRALKGRKPTTMESRIALMETATKERSDEEYYDDVKIAVPKTSTEKSQPKPGGEKPKRLGEETDISLKSSRTLLKVKSEQQLISPIVKSPSKDRLRRGYSCASIEDLSKDAARGTSEISRGEAEDERGGVISFAEEIDFESVFPDSERRTGLLPLSTVAEISRFLEGAKFRGDASAADMLRSLADEFASRLIRQCAEATASTKRRAKLTARLVKLLADSKRYLDPDKFPSDLIFSTPQPLVCNTRLLRRVLPLESYNLIAPLLGMPLWYPREGERVKGASSSEEEEKEEEEEEEEEVEEEEEDEEEGAIPFDLVVHPPTTKISTRAELERARARLNPYALFLRKPRRKVVTWRPLTADDLKGYDPEATLDMRTKNITDRICREFCEWLRDLGGTESILVNEEVLGDMFEIVFTGEASRTMEMSMKEMPMVPNGVAAARQCPDAGELAMTRKQLIRDAKAESKPAKTIAFGTAIPWELQFVPPENRVRERWLRCEHVMPDLETMDVVWDDIMDLESVKAFVRWFREHYDISLPEALTPRRAKRAVKLYRTGNRRANR
ncbi:uncharacterized protein LOC126854775 [Cataglyphis hispanica]|uniref:uncharacterized protein LOC126854775 n=1 Tax=Cataglyphis hispanica TaxID=1086592 RepID=UPI00217F60BA|nr:uncharacterized protein LOC126854775 [Cataglyphis hispanica]